MKKRDAMDKLLEDTRRYAERFPNLCDSAFWLAFLKRVEELTTANFSCGNGVATRGTDAGVHTPSEAR